MNQAEASMKIRSISRRQFVKGALIVSFSFSKGMSRALAQSEPLAGTDPQATSLDSWLAVAQDGGVTVYTGKVELGTGVETALAQIIAEELDVPIRKIKMEMGDTAITIDQAVTAASRTIERGGPQLRQAAAAARQELLKLASKSLETPVESLTVSEGIVGVIGNPSKKISYGNLIGGRRFNVKITASGTGWDMKVAPEVRAKAPKDYKVIGASVPRMDLPPKFTGEFTYSQDVRVPNMVHGRVVRPPAVNSAPSRVDESSIAHIPGVLAIIREGNFLGVVAKTEWSAIQAAQDLKASWSVPATKLPADREEVYAYLKNTQSFKDQVAANKGNLESAMTQASKTFKATYRWPFQLHGMIGPSSAVADVRGDRATIWAGSQGPFLTRTRVAGLLGIPEQNVHVIYREGSGSYGRLESDDAAEDAAVMSRSVGRPVRVQWSRQDEHGWEPKGPAQLMTIQAGVDSQGRITTWDYMDRSFPWTESFGNPLLASQQIGLKATAAGFLNGTGGGGQIYTFDNQRIVAADIPWVQQDPTPLRTSNLRAPGDLARSFASECFLDEIASNLRADPVQFRLQYLNANKRATEALLAVADKAQWQQRRSPAERSDGSKATGRGVALADRANTISATVAEVQVDKSSGKVAVKRITISHDCGLIVNPDGLKNQIEGNIIQGVSRTLMEEVQFDASGIKSLDWASYPILTFRDVPEIEIVLINRPDMPALGGGEPSIVSVPAAIANAVFDAVGVRLRQVPLTPQRVLSALDLRA
jgi:nicotinate dehydrogenase subunit B